MHTLNLAGPCCGLVVVVDGETCGMCVFDWGVMHEQGMTSAQKERRRWVHSWTSCRTCTRWIFHVRVVV